MAKTNVQENSNEEWRALDAAREDYDPSLSSEALAEARSNIGKLRQDEVALRLVDRDGRSLPGVTVQVEQTGHAFPFGDQLWSLDAMIRDGEGGTGRARAWKQRFLELFNAATNLCYWTERHIHDASKSEEHQGELRIENFAATVDWCNAHGLVTKGHPLFWSLPKAVPEWVMRYDAETLMKFAEVRVRNLVARFRGRVKIWDVVNEPMWETTPGNLANRVWPHIETAEALADYIEPVIRWCRQEDPGATLLVNDYGMEIDKELTGNDGSKVTAASQRRRYRELFHELDRRGASPDAIGLQSHSGWFARHEQQWAIYDDFAETGLPVHITEFWAQTKELEACGRFSQEAIDELQAEYIANYLTCAFGHPKVEAFFFWGLMGSAIRWRERAGHELTPVYHRIRELIHEEWTTKLEATTDADGVVRFRGFHGRYLARIAGEADNGEGKTFQVSAERPNQVTLRMSLRGA